MERPATQRIVRCPTCAGDSRYAADNPYRPFCSARCKNVDFGDWASERFRLRATPSPDDPEAPQPADDER